MPQFLERTLSKKIKAEPVSLREEEPFIIRIKVPTRNGLTVETWAAIDTGCSTDLVDQTFARQYLWGKEASEKKHHEIHEVKMPGVTLSTSGEWYVPITATCSKGNTISFVRSCAGIKRAPSRPPIVLGMPTLETQNIWLAPRIRSWWQSPPTTPFVGPERIMMDIRYDFVTQNSVLDNPRKTPLWLILDTSAPINGVCINFARENLSPVMTATRPSWVDAGGVEHPCYGLWMLPLCLRSSTHQERSFTTLCWGMDLGEPSFGGHPRVRLSMATLVEQDIRLDCRNWTFHFHEELQRQSWVRKMLRSAMERTKLGGLGMEKILEVNTDE